MNYPTISFGQGFMSSKIKSYSAPVYALNTSNGMPIVSKRKYLADASWKGHKMRSHKIKKK